MSTNHKSEKKNRFWGNHPKVVIVEDNGGAANACAAPGSVNNVHTTALEPKISEV
jgi:hypothetical protein